MKIFVITAIAVVVMFVMMTSSVLGSHGNPECGISTMIGCDSDGYTVSQLNADRVSNGHIQLERGYVTDAISTFESAIHYYSDLNTITLEDEQLLNEAKTGLVMAQKELDIINQPIQCGNGTIENGYGQCVPEQKTKQSKGGGCLIATATYGSEMETEVQQLRELRDNQLMNTVSGTQFMAMFNDIYYSFSPIIADYERENPYFKEAVKIAITPMISSLSLMENAETESEVLGLGLSVITLNLGIYLGVPAVMIVGIRKRI
jgi:hypothetical protein